jgi:hypothetical protein
MIRRQLIIALVAAAACDRSSPPVATKTASSTTSSSTTQLTPAQELPGFPEYKYENAATDSAWGSWPMDFSEAQNGGDLVIVSHVRHPSGLLVIRLDTAIRVAGQTDAGPMYADSVVVPGLEHGEYLGFYCALPDGSGGEYVAGLVHDADTLFRPRLAWKVNGRALRIEPYPTDSIKCRVTDPLAGEVD